MLCKGSIENINQRLETHNKGLVKFTSKRVPWKLVLTEEFDSGSDALKREKW